MKTRLAFQSNLAIPPGEYLLEAAQERGMSQVELARRMGRPVQAINEMVKGDKAITPDTALQLEQVLGVPAHIWTGLESEYQLTRARQHEAEQVASEAQLVEDCPYAEMSKIGWVSQTRIVEERVRELRRFFGVASLRNLENVVEYQAAFRRTNAHTCSGIALAAVLRRGELVAHELKTNDYNSTQLRELLPRIREWTRNPIQESLKAMRAALAEVGVALITLPHLPKTYLNGATFWLQPGKKAVALITLRGKWADIFWFTVVHELGHILLHDKRERFLEVEEPVAEALEEEANRFAANTLIPDGLYQTFVGGGNFTRASVVQFADSIPVASGILVGRLQRDKFLGWGSLLGLKEKYVWANSKDQKSA